MPTRGMFPIRPIGCCACAANGHAAAELRTLMNSRRLIASPRRSGQGFAAAQTSTCAAPLAMSALGQKQTFAVHEPMSAKCQWRTSWSLAGRESLCAGKALKRCSGSFGIRGTGFFKLLKLPKVSLFTLQSDFSDILAVSRLPDASHAKLIFRGP